MDILMIEKILTALEDCCFDEFYDESFESVTDFMDTNFFEEGVGCGATKLVLFPKEYKDIVVKIPFPGSYFYNDNEELELDDFRYAIDGKYGWDYCEAEALKYNQAKERNLEFVFLKTTFIGYVHEHPIYIQPRIEETESRRRIHTPFKLEDAEKVRSKCFEMDVECFSSFWINDFLNLYGEFFFRILTDFLNDCYVNDLHGSNIGYYKGKPVIFDYSGYWD